MIETPTATAFTATSIEEESVDVDDPLLSEEQKSEKAKLRSLEQDLFLVKQTPITAKLRTTVKHLRSVGGRLARFRGLQVAIVYHMLHGFIVGLFSSDFSTTRPVVSVLSSILLWQIPMAWTHIVISNPSSKRWYQRLPSRGVWRQILPATALFAIAQQAAVYAPMGVGVLFYNSFMEARLYDSENPNVVKSIIAVQALGVMAVAIAFVILVVIPAHVTLRRVQASMLPEEDETIVPFDRSFGGRVQPQILGGSGCVSMTNAWRSFDRPAAVRLLKVYAKVIAIQIAATVFFVLTIVGELRLIMGEDFNKAIDFARKQMTHKD